ncbi:hypothetical protein [Planctomicrobium piriforme]|uniref:Uncharacterized protein n=1 Tax=Planctomicrobium piriforme TaxID=1576369 RepID=A0A1I3EFW9_9PLAN|nr:hypothetical protein [Planctomicrobium piriforme]SFH97857.1 hypothetical protein SAMN05421753_104205 [Planctomicrobium piriforme]
MSETPPSALTDDELKAIAERFPMGRNGSKAVSTLLAHIAALTGERDRYKLALEHIRAHQVAVAGPNVAAFSATWHIADKALKGDQ